MTARTPCLDCGTPCVGSRCPTHKRQMYGGQHQTERLAWLAFLALGRVDCWRCGQPIRPGEPFDLGHRDGLPRHPEHPNCNRAAR